MSAPALLARRQLLRAPRRVAAVLIAAMLSALAIMTTGTFIGTMQAGMRMSISAPTANADLVVQFGAPGAAVEQFADYPGVERIEPLVSTGGRLSAAGANREAIVQGVPVDAQLRWMRLADGEWPSGRGEAALSTRSLADLGLAVGDEAMLELHGAEPVAVRIAAAFELPSGAEGGTPAVYVDSSAWSELAGGALVRLAADADPEQVVAAMNADHGEGTALPADAAADALVDRATGGTGVLATVFLAFVAIALVAAAMVIRNTFQVLLAQRLRENGLLRLVGATGGQVQRAVLVEALLVGAAGAAAGTIAGAGLGWAIASAIGLGGGGPQVHPMWAVAAMAVTVLVTMQAAWAPAAGTRSLSPIAALSASATTERRTHRSSIAGWIVGTLVTAIGAGGLAFAAFIHDLGTAVLAGLVAAIGLIVLVPLLVRLIAPLAARLLALGGPIPKLAGENLVRTSRRSGTVVLAIALGGSLVLAMLTAVSSVSATLNHAFDRMHRVDAVVQTRDGSALTEAQLAAIAALEGVQRSAPVRTIAAETSAPELMVDRVAELPAEWAGRVEASTDGALLLSPFFLDGSGPVAEGAELEVRAVDGAVLTLRARADRVASIGATAALAPGTDTTGAGVAAVVSPTVFSGLGGAPIADRVWIDVADDSAQRLVAELTRLVEEDPSLVFAGPLHERAMFEQIAGFLIAFVLAMLALTIVISAVGLANVVALSVAERRRELALLRALGADRGGVRTMVVLEAVALAVIGAVLSIAIGVPLGLAAIESAVVESFGGTVLAVPWPTVAIVLGAAVVLGVGAGLAPAHRAARTAPAEALTRE